jgi:hypothetical protein
MLYWVWSDYSFANTNLLGDNLAAYVDAGGGVVKAMFAVSGYPNNFIGGAFTANQYQVVIPGSFTAYSQETLGAILLPAHPLMSGVTTFDGGPGSYRTIGGTLVPQGLRVANWTDGEPLITYRDDAGTAGNKKRVDLGLFPPSDNSFPYGWNSSTNGAIIMKNALLYVATPTTVLSPNSITTHRYTG